MQQLNKAAAVEIFRFWVVMSIEESLTSYPGSAYLNVKLFLHVYPSIHPTILVSLFDYINICNRS